MTSIDMGFDRCTMVGSRAGIRNALGVWDTWRPFSAVGIRFTGFRDVNAEFGHNCGDEALREVARRIGRVIPPVPDSYLARISGAGFVVLVRTAEAAEAEALGARVVEAIGAPYEIGGRPVALRAGSAVVVVPAHRKLDLGRFFYRPERDVIEAAHDALDRASDL